MIMHSNAFYHIAINIDRKQGQFEQITNLIGKPIDG